MAAGQGGLAFAVARMRLVNLPAAAHGRIRGHSCLGSRGRAASFELPPGPTIACFVFAAATAVARRRVICRPSGVPRASRGGRASAVVGGGQLAQHVFCCPQARFAASTARAAAAPADARDAPPSDEADSYQGKRPSLRIKRNEQGSLASLTVTTPLFYANGPPHIGSAYPTINSDVMARYAQLRGAEVHFVTGMDEHGEKIAQTAASQGKVPQDLVDAYAIEFQQLWDRLSIKPDHFARTTPPAHKAIVAEMWQRCLAKGDIYKKNYEGWYCVGCEAYLDDDEMQAGHVCKIHQKKCDLRSEENYFFRLSKYWDQVKQHILANSDFILPLQRQSQVLVWLEDDNKRDFSISRASTKWGIPVPGDDSQVVYVWFDALLGYLSSLLRPEDPPTLDSVLLRGWPADVHIIGKDIMRFHALYWPAMLLSADLPLPKHLATHGFLTKDGLKMGKSLGNVVEPLPLVDAFGADAVRFFFASCMNFGEDGDFSYEVFIKRVNSSLANELGNLVHRILTLCRKNLAKASSPLELLSASGKTREAAEEELAAHPVRCEALKACAASAACYECLDFPKAAEAALRIAGAANLRMTVIEPWAKLKKDSSAEDKETALREMLIMAEGVRICAVLLAPITPQLSKTILTELGVDAAGAELPQLCWADSEWSWDALPGLALGEKPTPVFQRIDIEPWKGK
ncbi:unnamed protein product [Polarella glacialis]|uniref:methionine--tRNA ligase n=1 Tax=Polarella glacialis TaxID=89957 RepID=A0A813KSE9_POLGL|nr:unnamed protein product [Polarella glacialis]